MSLFGKKPEPPTLMPPEAPASEPRAQGRAYGIADLIRLLKTIPVDQSDTAITSLYGLFASPHDSVALARVLDREGDLVRRLCLHGAWDAVGWRNIRTDLSPQIVLDLALLATQIPVRNVNNVVVPSSTGNVGAQSVVFIRGGAQRLYADMRRDGVIGR